jgi:hypothetical protein
VTVGCSAAAPGAPSRGARAPRTATTPPPVTAAPASVFVLPEVTSRAARSAAAEPVNGRAVRFARRFCVLIVGIPTRSTFVRTFCRGKTAKARHGGGQACWPAWHREGSENVLSDHMIHFFRKLRASANRWGGMANTIDCSRMSHSSCQEPDSEASTAPGSTDGPAGRPSGVQWDGGAAARSSSFDLDYDCMNDCVSSLGVSTLLSAYVAGVGCAALPPACPIILGAGAGTIAGACAAACDELESTPTRGQ